MEKRQIVTFLSDYGLEDEFVGVCHGVMLRIAPPSRSSTSITTSFVRTSGTGRSCFSSRSATSPIRCISPSSIPSVGSERRAIVIETAWGEVFVGPDNGVC